ncbi:hypothetical protein Moror_15490 [Moniliophthora roreri MCA 2997]|uniref:Uncharacterized protein n=2 Tax=Moniliophthora roreri TaxID=221103 RepID=V2W645_MONRO|nr:hypothetical protein Moror_15490 [Moniliophthora roreri MCA 2997]
MEPDAQQDSGQAASSVQASSDDQQGNRSTDWKEDLGDWKDNQKKITTWYYNHRNHDRHAASQPLFKALSKPSCAPQQVSAFKQYMKMPEYALKVAAKFKQKYIDNVEQDKDEGLPEPEDEGNEGDEDSEKSIRAWHTLTDVEKKALLKTHSLAIQCHITKYLFQKEKKSIQNQI